MLNSNIPNKENKLAELKRIADIFLLLILHRGWGCYDDAGRLRLIPNRLIFIHRIRISCRSLGSGRERPLSQVLGDTSVAQRVGMLAERVDSVDGLFSHSEPVF